KDRLDRLHAHTPILAAYFSTHLPPHPNSTLFPYTTLFRSHAQIAQRNHRLRLLGRLNHRLLLRYRQLYRPLMKKKRVVKTKSTRDRKSTRLNSSHVAISYAVFCLKKKKQSLDEYSSTHRLS